MKTLMKDLRRPKKVKAEKVLDLSNFRDFIATLISKYGENRPFSLTSDHGDEYFNLLTGGPNAK